MYSMPSTPTSWKANRNNAFATLSASLTANGTSFTVSPTGAGGLFSTNNFWVTIEKPDGTNKEIVLIKSRSGDTFTIDKRGEQQSAPAAHAAGEYVRMLITAGHLDEIEAAINRLETGVISGSGSGTGNTNTSTGVSGTAAINFVIDGGGTPISAGEKGYLGVIAGTIKKVELFADVAGNATIDIFRTTDINWPNGGASLITSGIRPQLAASRKYMDTTLTGWNKGLGNGDILTFSVVSASTITKLTIVLLIDKSNVAPPLYTGPVVTFSPTPIPVAVNVDDPANPQRGSMSFQNTTFGPPNLDPEYDYRDVYAEFAWSDLEIPDPDNGPPSRDFSPIETMADIAASKGGRLNFRIYAMDRFNTSPDPLWPTYFGVGEQEAATPSGQYWIPPHNDAGWLGAAADLIGDLSTTYNGDPRIGTIFIGFLGQHGTFNETGINYTGHDAAHSALTNASRHYIIDQYYNAFTAKRLVMPAYNQESLVYALGLNPRIGYYIDDWGALDKGGSVIDAHPELVADRWKTAPVTGVPVQSLTGAEFGNLQTQINTFHVAQLMNGNQCYTWSTANYTTPALEAWETAFKSLGYRFSVSVDVPQAITNGPLQITTRWANSGVTPAYHPWRVVFLIQTLGGQDVWSAVSSVDLTTILSDGKTVVDSFGMGSYVGQQNVLPGQYNFCIRVDDVDGYFQPMQLAMIVDRQSDGRYILGQVTVTS